MTCAKDLFESCVMSWVLQDGQNLQNEGEGTTAEKASAGRKSRERGTSIGERNMCVKGRTGGEARTDDTADEISDGYGWSRLRRTDKCGRGDGSRET